MNKQTLFSTILLGLLLIACSGLVIAQNKINYQARIIEIDQRQAEIDEEILFHKNGYKISIEASEECKDSFLKEAEKEHEQADKLREEKKQLEEEKLGLMENR